MKKTWSRKSRVRLPLSMQEVAKDPGYASIYLDSFFMMGSHWCCSRINTGRHWWSRIQVIDILKRTVRKGNKFIATRKGKVWRIPHRSFESNSSLTDSDYLYSGMTRWWQNNTCESIPLNVHKNWSRHKNHGLWWIWFKCKSHMIFPLRKWLKLEAKVSSD